MAEAKISQNDQVHAHLKLYGSITALEAWRRYGIMRLGARIHDLKQAGHKFKTVTEHDGSTHYARYNLLQEVAA